VIWRGCYLLQAAVTVSAWSWDARATQEGSIDEEAESLT
jgi:hypothetical protein